MTNSNQQPTTNRLPTKKCSYLDSSIYLPSEKVPEFQLSHNDRNYLQLAKSCPASGWSKSQSPSIDKLKQPLIPHLGLKWKQILRIFFFVVLKETKMWELSQHKIVCVVDVHNDGTACIDWSLLKKLYNILFRTVTALQVYRTGALAVTTLLRYTPLSLSTSSPWTAPILLSI